jgi:hypothetical protein
MWKILGSDALYLEFADVWRREISKIVNGRERFAELMEGADVRYMMNGATEVHTFMVELPDTLSPEDVQFLADEILGVANGFEHPFVSLNGEYEKCQVIFTTEREPEIIGLDKKKGISAGAVFQPILDAWGGAGKNNML